MTSTSTAKTRPGRVASTIMRGTEIGIGLAVVANLVIFVVGNAGAPIEVITGWAPDGAPVTIVEVVLTAVVSVALGGALLWWWSRKADDPLRAWEAVAVIVAVGSALPLWRLDVDTGSKLALSLMHLSTGAAAIAGQLWARRDGRQG